MSILIILGVIILAIAIILFFAKPLAMGIVLETLIPIWINKHLVFRNDPDKAIKTSRGVKRYYAYIAPPENSVSHLVQGHDSGEGVIVGAILRSKKYSLRAFAEGRRIVRGSPISDFDVVDHPSEGEYTPPSEERGILADINEAARIRSSIYYIGDPMGGLMDLFRTIFGLTHVLRSRFDYYKEVEDPKIPGKTSLVLREGYTDHDKLEEQTHPFFIPNADTGGGEDHRIQVSVSGRVTFRIVNVYKPRYVAGNYVMRVPGQVVNKGRLCISARTPDELFSDGVTAKDSGDAGRKKLKDALEVEILEINKQLSGLGGDGVESENRGTMETWGIEIVRITIDDIILPANYEELFAKAFAAKKEVEAFERTTVGQANARARATVITATADKDARKLEGEGEEAYRQSLGKGTAGQIREIITTRYPGGENVTPDVALRYMEVDRNAQAVENTHGTVIASLGGTVQPGIMPVIQPPASAKEKEGAK